MYVYQIIICFFDKNGSCGTESFDGSKSIGRSRFLACKRANEMVASGNSIVDTIIRSKVSGTQISLSK